MRCPQLDFLEGESGPQLILFCREMATVAIIKNQAVASKESDAVGQG